MRIFAIAWLVTLLLIVNLSRLPSTWICIVFFAVTILCALFGRKLRNVGRGILVALLTSIMAFHSLATHQLKPHQVSEDLTVTLIIDSVPERQGRRVGFAARILSCDSCAGELAVERVRLSWYGRSPQLHAGERWQMVVRLKPPGSLRNPGGFDAIAWSIAQGLHARGYVSGAQMARRLTTHDTRSIDSIRERAAVNIQQLADDDDEYLGLMQGLSVGIKSGISDHQWELLRSTGTAHLLAISGLHVGLVAGWILLAGKISGSIFSQLAMRSGRTRPLLDLRVAVLLCSVLVALLYAMLAGFQLPTQRAVLMLSVWMIAAIRFRFLPPMAALCIALTVVLSANVFNPLSVGFWLSFGTVATLFYLHQGHLRSTKPTKNGWFSSSVFKLNSISKTHALLGLVMLPVSAWFFQTGSLSAPLANLVAVPWVALVCVPLALLTLLSTAVVSSSIAESVSATLFSLSERSLRWLINYLELLHSSELSSVTLVLPGQLAFVMCLVGLMIILGPGGLKLRVLALPLFFPALFFNSIASANDQFEVHFLDVGQGLAALVFAGDKTLLFDTGGKVSPQLSMFEAAVLPFLHASGRRQIDTLVVSHGDEDHAFGAADVVKRFPEVVVYASQPLPQISEHPVQSCRSGMSWQDGIVNFGFLHPDHINNGSDNNRSCVLLAYSGQSRVLLTGDIESTAEAKLVSNLGRDELFPITVISAPHHGSRTSSTQAFVGKLRPEYVVFAAGARNRYGFPHGDVQSRYANVGSTTFVTGIDGAVSFKLGPNGLNRAPLSWWYSHRRFWHGIVNPDCWQLFADGSILLRLLKLSQKGKLLCGK